MFTWTGVLDRPSYAWRAAVAIVFLIGTVFLFPFLLKGIAAASRCQIDTCGAVSLVASTALRPLFFVGALAVILSACIRRARDAGLRPWIGAFPPLMLVSDQGFLQHAGSGWAYPFSAGILSFHAPIYALFGLVLIGLLGLPSRYVLRYGGNRVLDNAVGLLAGWLSIAAALRASGFPPFGLTELPVQITARLFLFLIYAPYTMAIFLALAVYRGWRSHLIAPATPSALSVSGGEAPNLWQPKRAAVIGMIAALAVFFWSLSTKGRNERSALADLARGLRATDLDANIPSLHRSRGIGFAAHSKTRPDRCRGTTGRLDPIWPVGSVVLFGSGGQSA